MKLLTSDPSADLLLFKLTQLYLDAKREAERSAAAGKEKKGRKDSEALLNKSISNTHTEKLNTEVEVED